MTCKVADKDGVNLDAAVAAVQYAAATGAKIINASWGGSDYSQSLTRRHRGGPGKKAFCSLPRPAMTP